MQLERISTLYVEETGERFRPTSRGRSQTIGLPSTFLSARVTVLFDSDCKTILSISNDPQRFHVSFPCLDAVQDVVTTLGDKRGSL